MLHFLPAFILYPICFILFCLNLAVSGSIIFIGGLLKFLLPFKPVHNALYEPMHAIFRFWAINNFLVMSLANDIEWQITGDENLNKQSWYLVISNHISWMDIFVIAHIARSRIPEPKFFLKESLKRVPFLGMACWALDMPFMKRYSREFIAKNPQLKGKDIATTKRSCEKFKNKPTSIMNYIEGTRFTPSKNSCATFKHLLPPKAGGIAFTLATMGEQFDKVLNITLCYPDNTGHVMNDLLAGRVKRIVVHIEQIDITEEIIGDYFNDERFKTNFQLWLNTLWQEKDNRLAKILNSK